MKRIHAWDEKLQTDKCIPEGSDGMRVANGGRNERRPSLPTHPRPAGSPIRIGFTALIDCAPLVVAQELGYFARHGLEVTLTREVGWATIRDKIIYGELDAAQAPAGMLVAVQCGLGTVQSDCLTGLVLNLNGNAITLSQRLWRCGVHDGPSLREYVHSSSERLTFGIVYQHSSHSFLLRNWLRSHRIDPEREVQLVVVPPAQVHANLKAGHLDGYCVGEPWNSVAVMCRTGWVAATSTELEPQHPEKVLMVRRSFAMEREAEHLALIAALIEAGEFCDAPGNRERLVELLAQPEVVNAPVQAVRMSLGGTFDYGNGRLEKTGSQHVFHSGGANDPTPGKLEWVIRNLMHSGAVADPEAIDPVVAQASFSQGIYQKALALLQAKRRRESLYFQPTN